MTVINLYNILVHASNLYNLHTKNQNKNQITKRNRFEQINTCFKVEHVRFFLDREKTRERKIKSTRSKFFSHLNNIDFNFTHRLLKTQCFIIK